MKSPRRYCPIPVHKAHRQDKGIEHYTPPTVGFCDACECFVDEPKGKLHRPSCSHVPAERRRAA